MAKKTAKKKSATSANTTRKSAGRKTASKGTARKTTARKGAARNGAARKGAAKKASRRTPNAAFMAPVTPSASLSEVVGSKPIPRTEVTKRLWAYIKKHKLQDPKNARMIRADATLKPVFGGKSTVNMFEMTKLVNRHLS